MQVQTNELLKENAENKNKLKLYKKRIESLELKLVRAKQDLGEAMNVANDFETKNISLRAQLEKLQGKEVIMGKTKKK